MSRVSWLAVLVFAAGCSPPEPAAVLDALLPEGRYTESLAALADRAPLAPDQDFRAEEIGRDAGASQHVVSIRSAEVAHRHDRHDLLVVMLRGHGTMRMGDEARPVGEGSILWVPRGTPHAFANASAAPAVAYAVYVPPFDGRDRVLLDEAPPPSD
ncbi:MAG: cupin domain-containing protein [Myxococcales bacterium]|nr:cupin domain-containing protein [Myxococcales bacterium]